MRAGFATLRLYVAGRLVDEASASSSADVDTIAARHAELAGAAEARGQRYMVEIVFADGDQIRWGSDPDGMVEPIYTTDVTAHLTRRYRPDG